MNSAETAQPASAAGQRLATAQAIRDAVLQCQSERNSAWLDLARLLVPYTRDVDASVQQGAFELLQEVACAAPRFPAPLFADLTAACTCKDPARKAAALPALAATARTWPVQPVCWRYQRAVAAIDEALLTACAAGADLDARVRAHAAMAVQALVGAAPRYLELALRKRGTLQMDAAAAGAVNAAQLPAGNEARLDSAAGVIVDLLEDEFDFVRSAALQSTAAIAARHAALAPLAAELQCGLLTDDVAAVRCAALAALKATLAAASVSSTTITAPVLRSMRLALEDSEPLVRLAAVSALSGLPYKSSEQLAPVLQRLMALAPLSAWAAAPPSQRPAPPALPYPVGPPSHSTAAASAASTPLDRFLVPTPAASTAQQGVVAPIALAAPSAQHARPAGRPPAHPCAIVRPPAPPRPPHAVRPPPRPPQMAVQPSQLARPGPWLDGKPLQAAPLPPGQRARPHLVDAGMLPPPQGSAPSAQQPRPPPRPPPPAACPAAYANGAVCGGAALAAQRPPQLAAARGAQAQNPLRPQVPSAAAPARTDHDAHIGAADNGQRAGQKRTRHDDSSNSKVQDEYGAPRDSAGCRLAVNAMHQRAAVTTRATTSGHDDVRAQPQHATQRRSCAVAACLTPDTCTAGAADHAGAGRSTPQRCSVRVLQAIARVSRAHAPLLEAVLPLMLHSQHGFVWPAVAPLQRLLAAAHASNATLRSTATPSGDAVARGLLGGPVRLRQPRVQLAARWHADPAACSRGEHRQQRCDSQVESVSVDLCNLHGTPQERAVFGAIAALVALAAAAEELPAMLRRVPVELRHLFEPVRRRACVGDWPVSRVLPARELQHVGSVCEAWALPSADNDVRV